MGNIEAITRYGLQDNNRYGKVDDLTFTYNGNQIVKVDDAVSGPFYSGAFHFVDGSNATTEYTYDKNGNMTKDLNKGISSIQYNLLNLPSSINKRNGYIRYKYNAVGQKLQYYRENGYEGNTGCILSSRKEISNIREECRVLILPDITEYCNNIIYDGNEFSTKTIVLNDEGYVTFSGTTPQYHFYLKDHIGSNRVVLDAGGTIEQVNHYYPFGGLMGESFRGDVQAYKYNGKELDRVNGLDWYDDSSNNDDDDWWRRDYDDWDDNDNYDDDNDLWSDLFDCYESDNKNSHNNNENSDDSHKDMVLKWASSMSDELKRLIDKLSKEGRIKIMNTLGNMEVKNPKYDQITGYLILPPGNDYNVETVIHEIIHHLQDIINSLNYDKNSTNNEYEAYVLNYFLHISWGYINISQPHFSDADMWKELLNDTKGHFGKDENGNLWYDNSFIYSLENCDHNTLVNSFADYYRAFNGPKGYYQNIDPNYLWKWSDMLKRLGFKKK